MFFQPHTLYVKKEIAERDRYNRLVKIDKVWEEVCGCRCDMDGHTLLETEDGKTSRAAYHIVCPKNTYLVYNDEIRVMDGHNIVGEGRVRNIKRLNFLDYAEIWV